MEAIEEETTHRMAQSYSPTPYMRQIMSRMGRYLKADYQFWEEKGWLEGLEMEEGEKARPPDRKL